MWRMQQKHNETFAGSRVKSSLSIIMQQLTSKEDNLWIFNAIQCTPDEISKYSYRTPQHETTQKSIKRVQQEPIKNHNMKQMFDDITNRFSCYYAFLFYFFSVFIWKIEKIYETMFSVSVPVAA